MKNEEIIKRLEAIASAELVVDGLKVGAITKEAFEAIQETAHLAITALERDRWISASTPPDTNRFVLVMNDDGRSGVAQYVGDDIAPITPWKIAYCLYDVDTWDDEEQGPVCWWRELPEPPKEDEP